MISGRTQFQSAMRETLEIRAAKDETDFGELKAIYTDSEALSEIEVNDGTELYRACIMLPDKPREENDDED